MDVGGRVDVRPPRPLLRNPSLTPVSRKQINSLRPHPAPSRTRGGVGGGRGGRGSALRSTSPLERGSRRLKLSPLSVEPSVPQRLKPLHSLSSDIH